MGSRIKEEFRRVRDDAPGARFERAHERHRIDNRIVRLFVASLGCVLIVGAGVTFWLPGPQFVVALLGLAMVGSQSETAATVMDRAELYGREWHVRNWVPFRYKKVVLFLLWCLFTAAVVAVAWCSYELGIMPGPMSRLVDRFFEWA